MDYIIVENAVAKLAERGIKITPRWVCKMATRGEIDGAVKAGRGTHSVWLIPSDWAENWTRRRIPRKD